MFSQTAEYALRVIVYLATQTTPATTRQIAAATRIPEGYLAKVLQNLAHTGLVLSQRGLHGGFVLGRNPTELTLFDVIAAVDSPPRIKNCPLSIKAHTEHNLCALHRRLDDTFQTVERSLRAATIADIIGDCSCSKPLCDGPCNFTVALTEAANNGHERNGNGAAVNPPITTGTDI